MFVPQIIWLTFLEHMWKKGVGEKEQNFLLLRAANLILFWFWNEPSETYFSKVGGSRWLMRWSQGILHSCNFSAEFTFYHFVDGWRDLWKGVKTTIASLSSWKTTASEFFTELTQATHLASVLILLRPAGACILPTSGGDLCLDRVPPKKVNTGTTNILATLPLKITGNSHNEMPSKWI